MLREEAARADRDLAERGDARLYCAAAAESFEGHRQPICPVRFEDRAGPIDSRAPSEQILDRDDHEARRRRVKRRENSVAGGFVEHSHWVHLRGNSERAHQLLTYLN